MTLHDRKHQGARREHEQRRAGEVGEALAVGIARLAQHTCREHSRDQADGEVDQENPTPAGLDQEPADRRAGGRGDRAGRRPDCHRERALLSSKLGEQDRQRGGHEDCAARSLKDTRPDEPSRAGRSGAQGGSTDEQDQAAHEPSFSAQEVGEATGRDEEGRHHDRVGAQDPRKGGVARAREVVLDARERDVDMLTMKRSRLATKAATETITKTR